MNTSRAERDAINPSPEQRATHLWRRIHSIEPRPTAWDIICFCTESIAVIAAEYEFLRPIVVKLISIVYTAHYSTPEPFPSCVPLTKESNISI
jgi:hypothetical protein